MINLAKQLVSQEFSQEADFFRAGQSRKHVIYKLIGYYMED